MGCLHLGGDVERKIIIAAKAKKVKVIGDSRLMHKLY